MSEIEAALRRMPLAITPLYVTAAVNAPIDLYSGSLTLRPDKGGSPSEGRVFIRWLPRPQAAFELTDEGLVPELADDWLRLQDLRSSCRVSILSASIPAGRFSGALRGDPLLPGEQVERVTFHLPNFHRYLGDAIHHEGWGVSRGRLLLRHRPWQITLDQVVGADALRETLDAEGGFAITNVGRIERSDGHAFSKSKAADLLAALYYFLSFCRGIWCGPVLAVGELKGATNLLQWEMRRLASWRYRRSWWPELEWKQGLSISRAFSGFMTLWNRPLWRNPLKNSIHWYVEANSNAGGVEGGIILLQTALELLSWLVGVEDPKTKMYTERQFDREFKADVRIRHLLAMLNIPSTVPAGDLPALAAAQARLGNRDGVGAVVAIRNAVVHPRRTRRSALARTGTSARIEALSLGLWFLEIALLRLFGYRGDYYSRLKSGTNAEVRAAMP
jgi:hypothetical protein